METTFLLKNLNREEESLFADYVLKKSQSIESLLTKFAQDAQLLKASIRKFDKHTAFEVEFCLIIPNKTLVAKETSHNINKAVDLAKDRLLSQIKKHLAHLRKERAHRSIRKQQTVQVEFAEEMV